MYYNKYLLPRSLIESAGIDMHSVGDTQYCIKNRTVFNKETNQICNDAVLHCNQCVNSLIS